MPFETTQDLTSSPPLGCPRRRHRTPDARKLRAPRPCSDAVAASFSLVAAAGPIATEASGALGVTVSRRWGHFGWEKRKFFSAWRIIPVGKYLGSPPFMSHLYRPFGRETTPLGGDRLTMVINNLLSYKKMTLST